MTSASPIQRSALRLLLAAACLCAPRPALAATAATLTVTRSASPFSLADTITVTFNGFSEAVHVDSTSTANSVASAFAAAFSRDYIKAGLCAGAYRNVITFKLKAGAFQPVSVSGSGNGFLFNFSGFPASRAQTAAALPPDRQTHHTGS